MSVHVIYIKQTVKEDGTTERIKMMRPVTTRDEYLSLRDSDKQKTVLKEVRDGNLRRKNRLLQMNYSCIPADDGVLKGCKTPSSTVGMDIDFVAPADLTPIERQAWMTERMNQVPELVLGKKEELGLLMLERSATKGYHLVFRRREELNQEDNLRWASNLLGVKFDEGAKDITRVFYTTTASADDLLYLDDQIFQIEEGTLGTVPFVPSSTNGSDTVSAEIKGTNGTVPNVPPNVPEYNGILYADIIRKYWELYNDGKPPVEGDRNVKTYELAVNLRNICDFSPTLMQQVIPNYFGDTREGIEEWRRTIESALKEPRKGMPYRMKHILSALKDTECIKATGGTYSTPPPMPKRLPPLIKLLTRNVPWFYKPAVATAVFPALGAHLHGVKFRYWDNVEHEPTFMNLLIGRQSIGKGTIKKPIEYIMEDIRQRDIPNRQREAEWKQKNPGAKQKKDPRPTDICIQMLIDNLTDAVFNQRIVDANNNGGRFIFTMVDEIEALKKVTSKGTADEVGLLIRKAFDNSLAGQERVGADSVSGIAPLRWNFNASTTPPNAHRFFGRMVNDGTVSRLDISTIILNDDLIDSDKTDPIQGIYDHAFASELKPYLERLDAASGLIECAQAHKLSLDMKHDNREMAHLYDSKAYRVFSYRANVIAWLKGMVLYVAHGYKWSKEIADFVRWTQQYNLWCKLLYFGQQLEHELNNETVMQQQIAPQNLLNLLPDEFTREEYLQMRQSQGRDGDGNTTLRTWTNRKYIIFDDTVGRYCKTIDYKNRNISKL